MAQHHRLREAQQPAHQSVVRGKRRGAVHLLQVAEKTAGFPGVGTGTAAACVCRVRASSTGVFHFRLRPDRPPHTGRRHRTAGKHAGRSNQRSHSRGPPCWVTSARWSTSIWRADTRICAAGSMVWRRSCSSFLWTRFQTACFCSAEGGATGSKALLWEGDGFVLLYKRMENWIIRCAEDNLEPMWEAMHEELLRREVVHADETVVQVLKENGRTDQSKSYMWVYRTGQDR